MAQQSRLSEDLFRGSGPHSILCDPEAKVFMVSPETLTPVLLKIFVFKGVDQRFDLYIFSLLNLLN